MRGEILGLERRRRWNVGKHPPKAAAAVLGRGRRKTPRVMRSSQPRFT